MTGSEWEFHASRARGGKPYKARLTLDEDHVPGLMPGLNGQTESYESFFVCL